MSQPRLKVVPIHLREANAYVKEQHRHHGPVVGYKFAVAVATQDEVVRGVAVVGRPVARRLDDGLTLEVNRLATDGTPNSCSALNGAAWRVAREMGYERLVTYVLASEPGTSLKAVGWTCVGEAGGGSWSVPSRPREDKHPTERKVRWEVGRTVLANEGSLRPAEADDPDTEGKTAGLAPATMKYPSLHRHTTTD